jgi:hypothetical protein
VRITGVAEANQQFTQLRQVGEWAVDLGAGFQQGELSLYGLTGTASGQRVALCEKLTTVYRLTTDGMCRSLRHLL